MARADCVAAIDRTAAGLPEQIVSSTGWTISHMNRAARTEPVTPPGQVYSSDAFAALAALQAPGEFRFDYIGRIPLPKSFGEFPMDHRAEKERWQADLGYRVP
jgi:hypothetical protein